MVKAAALAAGFDAAGIARVGEATPDAEHLRAWLAAGRQGSMNYMRESGDRRADIHHWAPFAKSILMVAQNYSPAGPGTADAAPGDGLVARYARGADYHGVMVKKLRKLGRALSRDHGEAFGHWRSFTDAGAILEKAWGAAAGLGWIGKNTLLLNRTQGSWFLLGGLALSCELEPDPPVANHCGECRACLDACPTGAFTAPWELDARQCLSYLTIETRDRFPAEFAKRDDPWLFGCDICQEVCPYNKAFAKPLQLKAFKEVKIAGHSIPLREILDIRTDEDFTKRFAGSPVMRAKRSGLQRNVRVALENVKR